MIAANLVGPARGFDTDTNSLEVFWHGGSQSIGEDSKLAVARQLIVIVAERYKNRGSASTGGTQAAS